MTNKNNSPLTIPKYTVPDIDPPDFGHLYFDFDATDWKGKLPIQSNFDKLPVFGGTNLDKGSWSVSYISYADSFFFGKKDNCLRLPKRLALFIDAEEQSQFYDDHKDSLKKNHIDLLLTGDAINNYSTLLNLVPKNASELVNIEFYIDLNFLITQHIKLPKFLNKRYLGGYFLIIANIDINSMGVGQLGFTAATTNDTTLPPPDPIIVQHVLRSELVGFFGLEFPKPSAAFKKIKYHLKSYKDPAYVTFSSGSKQITDITLEDFGTAVAGIDQIDYAEGGLSTKADNITADDAWTIVKDFFKIS